MSYKSIYVIIFSQNLFYKNICSKDHVIYYPFYFNITRFLLFLHVYTCVCSLCMFLCALVCVLNVCACMCVSCMHELMCVCPLCMFTCAYRGQRSTSSVFLHHFPSYFLRQRPSLLLEFFDFARLAANEL